AAQAAGAADPGEPAGRPAGSPSRDSAGRFRWKSHRSVSLSGARALRLPGGRMAGPSRAARLGVRRAHAAWELEPGGADAAMPAADREVGRDGIAQAGAGELGRDLCTINGTGCPRAPAAA